jgi:protease-4
MAAKSFLGGVFGTIGRWLDRLRRTLHLIFLLLVFLFLLAAIWPQTVVVPASSALYLSPTGVLVDQLSGDPLDQALAHVQGVGTGETLLKDLVDAVRKATEDERIRILVLDLDGLTGGGLSKLQDLGAEIDAFRESGKRVVSIGDSYSRDQLYLASRADEVYMNPMGVVLVEGYELYQPYYKSLLELASIDYNVWTAGEYKSVVEPVTRDDMSPQDREASSVFLNGLWSAYKSDVARARALDPEGMQVFADQYAELLTAAGGDAAQLALDFGLVDDLMTRGEMRDRVAELLGLETATGDDFPSISHAAYLQSFGDPSLLHAADDRIAVVVLSGTIYDGDEAPGAIGGDSATRLIHQASMDERVKALVVRVDSGGGSAFASEVILSEIMRFQASGRPLVVSMGSVAASGGYWISMSADEILASATTLTGSIGVASMLPTFQDLLARFGVNVDGIGTTELAGQFNLMRELGEDAEEYFGQSVASLYEQFVSKVAAAREQPEDAIDRVARGRVWTGSDALEAGLIDGFGTIDDAIESAATLAGLEADTYDVVYVEPELSLTQQLALELAGLATPVLDLLNIEAPWSPAIGEMLETASKPLDFLLHLNDPRGLYVLCGCDVR